MGERRIGNNNSMTLKEVPHLRIRGASRPKRQYRLAMALKDVTLLRVRSKLIGQTLEESGFVLRRCCHAPSI